MRPDLHATRLDCISVVCTSRSCVVLEALATIASPRYSTAIVIQPSCLHAEAMLWSDTVLASNVRLGYECRHAACVDRAILETRPTLFVGVAISTTAIPWHGTTVRVELAQLGAYGIRALILNYHQGHSIVLRACLLGPSAIGVEHQQPYGSGNSADDHARTWPGAVTVDLWSQTPRGEPGWGAKKHLLRAVILTRDDGLILHQ